MIELTFITIFIWMCSWFLVGQLIRRNDVADIAWGLGFVVLAWTLFINRPSVQLSLATLLVTSWGIRLSVHIFLRNRKRPEDYRYQAWRNEWGRWFVPRSFLQVFMLQGLLLILISAPLIGLGKNGQDSIHVVNIVGFAIWLVGFLFESIGDLQLKDFISKPQNKGKIMQSGLWRYTRHPNYFGEVTQWWGIWLVAYGAPSFVWAVVGPLTITILILKVSGIPMLEKRYQGNSDFDKYKQRTSIFFPLPQKKGK